MTNNSGAPQQHFTPSQQLMAAATNSLHKNLDDYIQRNNTNIKSGKETTRTTVTNKLDCQQGVGMDSSTTVPNSLSKVRASPTVVGKATDGSPIYFNE